MKLINICCFVLTFFQIAVSVTAITSSNENINDDDKEGAVVKNALFGEKKFPSLLLNNPHLLSSFHKTTKKNFVSNESTHRSDEARNYVKNDRRDDASSSEINKYKEAKKIIEKLKTQKSSLESKETTKNNPQIDDSNHKNRELVLNGHLSDVLVEGCDASYVYNDVSYDDEYTPECQCLLDQDTGIIWMECWLGNNNCLDVNDTPDNALDDECQGTYDIFFFHEPTGELESKTTCLLCHTPNCEEHFTSQICTEVFFDDDDEPFECNIIRIPNNTVSVCEECSICGGPASGGPYGVEHTCFDIPSNGCDTGAYALLHNFEIGPSPYIGMPDVGGLFAQVCDADAIDSVLYGDVGYDAGSSVLCDCDDPASGTIACDIHDPACFANLCTTVSEVFYFNRATGNYEFKWTIDWGANFLWTETHFDTVTGQALNCSVLSVDPITTELLACSNCQICDSAQDGKGIAFDCFGMTQVGTCDTTNGRARYNFASTTTDPPPPAVPIRGIYGQICSTDQPGRDLYDGVTYDTGFLPVCDCDNSPPGAIACDLNEPDCSTDLCTPISEVFFFSESSGNYRYKWTIDWEDSLWTETHFNTFTGQGLGCFVLESESNKCADCQICETDEGEPGITFSCFGQEQSTCDSSNGRATYNFEISTTDDENGPGPTTIPASSPTFVPAPGPSDQPTTGAQTEKPTSTSSSSSGLPSIKSLLVLCYLAASYGLL